jgi:hypothetical protein
VGDRIFPDHGDLDRKIFQQRFLPFFCGDIPVHGSEGDEYGDEQDYNNQLNKGKSLNPS